MIVLQIKHGTFNSLGRLSERVFVKVHYKFLLLYHVRVPYTLIITNGPPPTLRTCYNPSHDALTNKPLFVDANWRQKNLGHDPL